MNSPNRAGPSDVSDKVPGKPQNFLEAENARLREALERVKSWMGRGNPTGGMNLPSYDGRIPSIREDIRTLLAALTEAHVYRERGDRSSSNASRAATGPSAVHAPDCQSHIVDVRGQPDDCTCGAGEP